MSTEVDINAHLTGQLVTIANQGVSDNQRISMHTQFAFQKDLFQGGQGEAGMVLATLNSADRTPLVKAG